jgi:hypothetical protein
MLDAKFVGLTCESRPNAEIKCVHSAEQRWVLRSCRLLRVLGSLSDCRICWLLFVCIYSCGRLVFAHFASVDCKGGWVQFFVSNFLKEKRVFRCPCVVWNLLGHSYFRDVGCTQSKDLTSFKVFVFRLLQNCEKQPSGSSCLFVYPSFSPRGTTEFPMDRFQEILYLSIFGKWRKFKFN